MRIASVLEVTVGLLLAGGIGLTTVSAQQQRAPAPAARLWNRPVRIAVCPSHPARRRWEPAYAVAPDRPEDILVLEVSSTRSLGTAPRRHAIRRLRDDVDAGAPGDRPRNPTIPS